MGRQDEDARSRDQIGDAMRHPLGKFCISRAQALVEQQDFGVEGRRNGEAEAHHHACRIGPHRQREIFAQLAERFDFAGLARDFRARHAQKQAAGDNVLRSGIVDVEPGRRGEQRRDVPVNDDAAAGGGVDAGKHPQQRRLARAVVADEPDPVALFDVKIDAVERSHDLLLARASRHDRTACGAAEEIAPPAPVRAVNREVDGDILERDRSQIPGFL